MPTQTPLTDAINALTTYANTVTGASDTDLSSAVATLASGYGGGGTSTPPAFCLADYKVYANKWVIDSCVDNLIKIGGCLHIVVTVPPLPQIATDSEVVSIGADTLAAWSPSTNCSLFGAIYGNTDNIGYNSFALRLRGSSLNGWFRTYPFADANGKIDIKFYSDRFVDVLTNTTIYYSSDSKYNDIATAMENLCTHDYISVGCNQFSARWSNNVVELYAIEAN